MHTENDNRFPDKRIIRTKTGTQCESETLPDAVSLYKTYRQTNVTEQKCVSTFGKTSLHEDESEDLPVINVKLMSAGLRTHKIYYSMNRYDKTYHSYRELMCRLRNEFNEVNSHMKVAMTGNSTTQILQSIDSTIRTAEQQRNLPSAELYSITIAMMDYRKRIAGLPCDTSLSWKKCFSTISQASESLMSITDDPYVNKSHTLASSMIG